MHHTVDLALLQADLQAWFQLTLCRTRAPSGRRRLA
jgi:hypothetical protein